MTLMTMASQYSDSVSRSACASSASKHQLTCWLQKLIIYVDARAPPQPLHPAVAELKELIQSRTELRMWATAMFEEVPNKIPYKDTRDCSPTARSHVRGYLHMLELLSVTVREVAPSWTLSAAGVDVMGLPFQGILDWAMGTPSGHAFFLDAHVNAVLKRMLDAWRDDLLATGRSRAVLTTAKGHWLSDEAVAAMERDANLDGRRQYTFEQLFRCDPRGDPVHWGFSSWDDFFVRRFRDIDRLRPVGYPDQPEWVVNACESKPAAIRSNIQAHDSFWLKGTRYSVVDMLDRHPSAKHFIGGTVHQSVLESTAYHRWSAPVSGEVVYAAVVPGTYFSERSTNGLGSEPVLPPVYNLAYMGHVATRALVLIRGEDPVGLMCFVAIGIADVSTCEIAAEFAGDWPRPVRKGEELGMFHYGGSSQCLVFRRGLRLAFTEGAIPGNQDRNLAVRSPLAYAYVERVHRYLSPEYYTSVLRKSGFEVCDLRVLPWDRELIYWLLTLRLNIPSNFSGYPVGVPAAVRHLHDFAKTCTDRVAGGPGVDVQCCGAEGDRRRFWWRDRHTEVYGDAPIKTLL